MSLKNLGAITMFVEDPQRSKLFYQEIFGLRVVNEDENAVAFDFGNTIINLLKISVAHALIAPGAVAGRAAGSRFQLTIWVDDADAVCVELGRRGVALLSGPIDRPWGVRTAAFTDPDGHLWEVAQKLSHGSGSE